MTYAKLDRAAHASYLAASQPSQAQFPFARGSGPVPCSKPTGLREGALMRRILLAFALIGLTVWSGPLLGQDFKKGTEAYFRGDFATALQELKPLAERGDANSQTLLGALYTFGWGVRQDYAVAAYWHRLAAEQGLAAAQYVLAKAYDEGEGVPRDYTKAAEWFRLAANQGHGGAQTSLGAKYQFGSGVPQDYAEASRWFRLAAEQGYAVAQRNLGYNYLGGQGVIQDYTMAHMWLNIAASLGLESAAEARDIASGNMTLDQIAEAQRLARECVAKAYKDC